MERKLFAIFVRYLVDGSTNEPWARTRDLCVLAWKPLADTHLKEIAWTWMTNVGIQLFFLFRHRLYNIRLFSRKILTTKKLTNNNWKDGHFGFKCKEGRGLSKTILWCVNAHLTICIQSNIYKCIYFLSFFFWFFLNSFIVSHFLASF